MNGVAAQPALPIFKSRQCRLRLADQSDATLIKSWQADLKGLQLLLDDGGPDFVEELLRENLTAVVLDATDRPIGLVAAYGLNRRGRWAFVFTYLREEHRARQLGIEASFGFLEHLFNSMSLRKIYIDVSELNSAWLRSVPGVEIGLFREEGKFRQHISADGQLWDVVRLAIPRDQFLTLNRPLKLLFGGEPQVPNESVPRFTGTGKGGRCSGSAQEPSEESVDVVRRYFERWRTGDIGALGSLFAKNAVLYSPLTGDVQGVKQIEAVLGFRHRLVRVNEKMAGSKRIAWAPLQQRDGRLTIEGRIDSEGSVELAWKISPEGLISELSADGDLGVLTLYLWGDEPTL